MIQNFSRPARRPLAFASLIILAIVTMFSISGVSAEDSRAIQIEHFEPLPDSKSNILNVATGEVLPHLGWSTGALLHYSHKPLKVFSTDANGNDTREALLNSQSRAEIWGGVGFYDWVDIGVMIPIVISSGGETGNIGGNLQNADIGGASLSDVRIVPRVSLLRPQDFGGVGLALSSAFYLPTGDTENFTGEGTFRIEPRLSLSMELPFGLVVATNLAYQIREEHELLNIKSDDIVRWSLGARVPVAPEWSISSTYFGHVQMADGIDPSDPSATIRDGRANPMELLVAADYFGESGLTATVGGGAGLSKGIGSPEFRVLLSAGYRFHDPDYDKDGILNNDDECPEIREDIDGFEDEDGCPDMDNDGDKILDSDDDCPDEAEDMDGFEDGNGCPDPDNDGDKILDGDDECPNEAEDMDGFEDANGCPDTDNDNDGILDVDDSCKDVAEDMDGFEDADGCPDPDNDGDGFCDPFVQSKGLFKQFPSCQGSDKCPDEKEIINGVDDDDGCPDEGKTAVVVTGKKIELKEQVFFASGKDVIKEESFSMLSQVAKVLETNPQVTKILIEGHTDDAGKDSKNMKLSEQRAAAVQAFFEKKGIASDRMSSVGHGETDPLVPIVNARGKKLRGKKLKVARAQNRRVVIKILEIDGKPITQDGE